MIDPIQAPAPAAPSASTPDPSTASATTGVGVVAGVQKTAAPSNSSLSSETAQAAQSGQAAASNSATPSQVDSETSQPLRLLIEHDKTTNQYVYKLYDSSGRIVREIPQESLAEAQKQAGGSPGSLFDTTV